MTLRTPLVMVNGQIQQLQAGDSMNLPSGIAYTADSTFLAGQVGYPSASGHLNLAKANTVGTSKNCSLATAGIASAASGIFQNSGVLRLTTTQWDAVAGTTGGLIFNTEYYLSDATAGMLTGVCPSTAGSYVIPIGIAISTTDLQLYDSPFAILL